MNCTGILLLIICVASSAGASILIKIGAKTAEKDMLSLIHNSWIWFGGLAYGTAFLGYIACLKVMPLSLAQPAITAGVTALTLLVALFYFDESLNLFNWLGFSLLLSGIILVSWNR